MRRVHHKLKPLPLVKTETGVRVAHHADPDTGTYRGRDVIEKSIKKSSKTAE